MTCSTCGQNHGPEETARAACYIQLLWSQINKLETQGKVMRTALERVDSVIYWEGRGPYRQLSKEVRDVLATVEASNVKR